MNENQDSTDIPLASRVLAARLLETLDKHQIDAISEQQEEM